MPFFGRPSPESRMSGYNFTERVRKVLGSAREESARFQHEYVGTEHILLGLLRETDCVSSAVLDALGADREAMRGAIEAIVKHGNATDAGPDLPYTSRAKKVLELAMGEARALHHSYVGTEHLLLGLVAEEKGIAAQVLAQHGVTLAAAREETGRILGAELPPDGPKVVPLVPPARGAPAPSPADRGREELAWGRLRHALEVSARLGVTPALELQEDGTLAVSLGPELVVTVDFPPAVGLRRREGPPPAPPA